MQIKDNNNKEVKKTRLDSNSEIYDPHRTDISNEELFKQMSRKDKLLYYKEYYLPYTIIVLVIIAILIYVSVEIHKTDSKKDTYYCGMLDGIQFEKKVEDDVPEKFGTYLKDEIKYKGYLKNDRIFFETFYGTLVDNTKLDGFYDRKRFDTFISCKDKFNVYATNDTLYDLSEILPKDLYQKVESKLVYATKKGTNQQVPYGILLDDCNYKFVDGGGHPIDSPILSIPTIAKHKKVAISFIKFLFE